MPKKVAVIDGNSLMHRAFHAVPPTMNAPDGTPTNAVFGFLSMLLKFIDMERPDALICAFDAGKPTFRMEAIEEYKANRPPTDDSLKAQFPVIEDMLTMLHIPVVKLAGWEGDDILGSVAALCERKGDVALLVSGDKDVYQLVSATTRVVTTKRGMSDVVTYGPAEVLDRYGVTPAQFPDFLGLKGDASDNIPGVPGIGDVSARGLLQKFGSLEGIYEHLDELKGKQRENLAENRERAFASREVATIVRDLDVEAELAGGAGEFPAFTADEARAAFLKYGMTVHLAHMLRFVAAAPAQSAAGAALELPRVLGAEEAQARLTQALSAGETVGVAVVEAAQESLFGDEALWGFAFADGCAALPGEDGIAAAQRALCGGQVACFDGKGILQHLVPADAAKERCLDVQTAAAAGAALVDCSLAAYLIDSSVGEYGAEAVISRYAPWVLPEDADAHTHAAALAVAALALAPTLRRLMEEHGVADVYTRIDAPLQPVLVEMERTGVALDRARLEELSRTAHAELDKLRGEIVALAGQEFNLDSPTQLSHILFEKIGLKPRKKTQRGYSTDASVLKELAAEHPLPGLILNYREQAKLASTYLDALPRLVSYDGRIHAKFNQLVTTTGRLSSSDPNLQNIPVRTDFGRLVREAFVPLEPGHVFLSADYSQIELRLLAHLSADPALIEAFRSGADFHASTAARVFGVPLDAVTPQLRSRAKAVNFGIVYGQQAFGLAQSLGIPFGEAKEIIERYFASFPRVREYLDDVVAGAYQSGYAETMFGRRRYIAELQSPNAQTRAFGERTAMNHPMQGSAADIIKLAMCRVAERLGASGLRAHMMIQVHDELDFSVEVADAAALGELVRETMEQVVELRVPLIADVSQGENWAQAH